MKRVIIGILIVLVIVVGMFKVGSEFTKSRHLEAEEARVKEARRAQLQRSITEMINKHNAVIDWHKGISSQAHSTYRIYTVEIQRALRRHEVLPIFFLGSLRDIAERNGEYYAVLDGWRDLAFGITFILKLQPEQLELFLDDSVDRKWNMYAVVATVGSAEGIPFHLVANPLDSYVAEISLDAEGSIIARGTCLDLLFMGSDWVAMRSVMKEQGVK